MQPAGAKNIYRYPFGDYEERAGDALWRVNAAGSEVEVRQAKGLRVDAALLDELTTYVNAPQGRPKPLPTEWLDLDGDGDGFDAGDLAIARQALWDGTVAGAPRFEWRYVQRDVVNSTVLATDSAGDAVTTRQYEPYGTTAQRSGVTTSRGYAGAEIEADDDLGLIRMGARYYAPALGRWITPDHFLGESPTSMASHLLEANLYSYAANTPITRLDPSGNQSAEKDDPFAQQVSAILADAVANPSDGWGATCNVNVSCGPSENDPSTWQFSPGLLPPVDRTEEILAEKLQRELHKDALQGVLIDPAPIVATMGLSAGLSLGRAAGRLVLQLPELLAAEGVGAAESRLPEYLYHYTSAETASLIENSALGQAGRTLYLTPNGGLSPIQAGIELALPQTNTASALFRVSTSALESSQISRIGAVTGNVLGRGGGGIEVLYNGEIPLNLVIRVR